LLKKKLKNSTMERLIIPIFAKIYFCLLKPWTILFCYKYSSLFWHSSWIVLLKEIICTFKSINDYYFFNSNKTCIKNCYTHSYMYEELLYSFSMIL
jgi:hypothetical protein